MTKRLHNERQWLEPLAVNSTDHEVGRKKEATGGIGIRKPDEFGNRTFFSNEAGFFDNYFKYQRGGTEKISASLLVSPEGQALLRSYPHFLSEIDTALTAMTAVNSPHLDTFKTNYGELSVLKGKIGMQSERFVINLGVEGKIKIRVISSDGPDIDGINLPLNREMRQVQTIKKELADKLAKMGVELPVYYFASGQVAAIKYEEGTHPNADVPAIKEKILALKNLLSNYIRKQQDVHAALWSHTDQDVISVIRDVGNLYRTDNFIERPDGILVCIDPFKGGRHLKV